MRSRSWLAVVPLLAVAFVVVSPLHAGAQIIQILDSSGDGINSLDRPRPIAVDFAGNVYVGGRLNVFKVTPSGTITEIIDSTGDGAGNSMDDVSAVAVDANANVFVAAADTTNLFKITPSGTITEIIDFGGESFLSWYQMAIDASDNLFIAIANFDNVYKISPSGTITEIIDATGDGAGRSLDRPLGLAVDSASNVYVSGLLSENVFKITPAGTITEIINVFGDGAGNFLSRPREVGVDSFHNVYVAGSNSNNVFKISSVGTITEIIDNTGDGIGNGLESPQALAVDADSNVYVTGIDSDNVFVISPIGTIVEIIASSGDLLGNALNSPRGVVTLGSERVYITGYTSDNVFEVVVNQCSDGFDNDGDSFTDFPNDPGCATSSDPTETNPETACDDGLDNDGDGLADQLDPGCDDLLDPSENSPILVCDDGADNDGDGLADHLDPGCDDPLDPSENSPTLICDDGIDNDFDGLTDFPLDPGCLNPTDTTEDTPACADEGDNDSDGLIDFPLDPGCEDLLDDSENSPTLVCDDGIDNDSDGFTDFPFDPGCANPTYPTEFVPNNTFGPREWTGSLEFKFGALPPITLTGVGVATLSGSGTAATTLNLAGRIAGTAAVPVTDPEVTSTIASYIVSASLGSGQLAPFSMSVPLTQQQLPVPGILKVCIIFAGCGSSLPLVLVTPAQEVGIGVGGVVTVGYPGPIRLSLFNAPWTLGIATLTTQTANGAYATVMDSGFIHGQTSTTATTLPKGASLRLVAPIQVVAKGIAGNSRKIALFTSLNIQFIPEPKVFLGIAAGAVALMALGRRTRKRRGD